ncbi:MAG: D-alanyl-D-alanine carboxypeptidase [Rubellimicrobium sp.]|nr:D-alanyl-D-alanine carboxypeptidase [Rubellimicrobium sp.]
MSSRLFQSARIGLLLLFIIIAGSLAPVVGHSAPFAAMVMDARNGEVIHAQNADTRLHPASLTKMMTLYVAFQAISRGEITLDTDVRITAEAANQPPSKLGLRTGQTIRLRYLLRASAVRSANDAATAIAVAISGSEAAFAERMNATARAMGMNNTNFLNAHGLTQQGQFSTARDMSILGRHLIYDFPQYYNLFSRRTADAGIAQVNNTNTRLLDSYRGADGIKTGFTNAAGYNLVASAERGNVRIIATVFGGTSIAHRTQRIVELLDLGFQRANANAPVRPPQAPGAPAAPSQPARQPDLVAAAPAAPTDEVAQGGAARTIRVTGQVQQSLRPIPRPTGEVAAAVVASAVSTDFIESLLAEVTQVAASGQPPVPSVSTPDAQPETLAALGIDEAVVTPEARPAEIIMTAAAIAPAAGIAHSAEAEVVARISTSGGRHWGINIGRYPSRNEAERVLLQVALTEATTLDGGLRRVVQRSGGFDANIMGLTRENADLACRRLQAAGTQCFMIGTEEG